MENSQEKTNKPNGDVIDEDKNAEPATENLTKEITDEEPVVESSEQSEEKSEEPKQPEKLEEPSEELLEKIKDQVEYYFGDVNMQRDKFLIVQSKMDDGWIPMTIMLNFKQLAALSKNIDVILKALECSDLIEISEDKKQIRRSPKYPLPEYNVEYRKAQQARTVYVKGFPLTGMTIDKLKEFFKPYKPFETIVMRKYQDKDKVYKFKGSIYVQFTTLDAAKAFMEIESVKYEDTELIRKWSADYTAEKAIEKEEMRKKKDKGKNKLREKEETDHTSEEAKSSLPKGSVIYFSGVPNTCTRENIKACMDKYDVDIAYIDFQRGLTEGWVRLQGENAAKLLLEKTDGGKVLVGDTEVTLKILDGEEENKYLTKVAEEIAASKNKFKSKRSFKKGRKGQGARKRSGSPVNAVPAKKTG